MLASAAVGYFMQQQHAWEFFRAGGVDQVVIRTGQDIAHIGELDQKLWVALACPTRGIEFDSDTLDPVSYTHLTLPTIYSV